jgi:hypothetical protein
MSELTASRASSSGFVRGTVAVLPIAFSMFLEFADVWMIGRVLLTFETYRDG